MYTLTKDKISVAPVPYGFYDDCAISGDGTDGEFRILSSGAIDGGSGIFLYTSDIANTIEPSEKGQFILRTGIVEGQHNQLVGRPQGLLMWGGQMIPTIIRDSNGINMDNWRFSNDMIVVGSISGNGHYNFPVPFDN